MKNVFITPEMLKKNPSLIPASYLNPVLNRELLAVLLVDQFSDNECVGIVIFGPRDNVIEIRHIELFNGYDTQDNAIFVLSSKFSEFEHFYGDSFSGVLASLSATADFNLWSDAFSSCGFQVSEAQGELFSFNLSQVQKKYMIKNLSYNSIVFLKNTDDYLLRAILSLIQEDPRPVPIELPINWDDYDPDLSFIRTDNGVPKGLMLVKRENDFVSIELGYDNDAKGFLKSISVLVNRSDELLSPDTLCIISAVNASLIPIVQKLIPDAKRNRRLIASKPFSQDLGFLFEE